MLQHMLSVEYKNFLIIIASKFMFNWPLLPEMGLCVVHWLEDSFDT